MRGVVPDDILDNPDKFGFVVPIREWFRDRPGETVYPVLMSGECRRRGLLEPRALERALRRHSAGRVASEQPDIPMADVGIMVPGGAGLANGMTVRRRQEGFPFTAELSMPVPVTTHPLKNRKKSRS